LKYSVWIVKATFRWYRSDRMF